MAGAAPAGGGSTRTWPELVGWDGEEAKEELEAKDPSLNVELVPYGELRHSPDKPNTVRLWLDADGTVRVVPTVEQPPSSTTSSSSSPNPATTKPVINTPSTGTKPANTNTKPTNTVVDSATKRVNPANSTSTKPATDTPQYTSGSVYGKPAHHGHGHEHFNNMGHPAWPAGRGHGGSWGPRPRPGHPIGHFPAHSAPPPPPPLSGQWPPLQVSPPPCFAHERPHPPFFPSHHRPYWARE